MPSNLDTAAKKAAIQRAYYARNKDRILEKAKLMRGVYMTRYDAAHPGRIKESARKYRDTNREAVRARLRAYKKANPEKIIAERVAYKGANKAKIAASMRVYNLRRKYGMSLEDFEHRKLSQGDKCPICDKAFSKERRGALSAVVDHDHTTGVVRGLLHSHCNVLLGRSGDSIANLQRAVDYLKRSIVK